MAACLKQGFALAGVAPAAPSGWADQFRDWLAAGRGGTMDYLKVDLPVRTDIRRLISHAGGARSVVMVADRYGGRGEAGAGVPAAAARVAAANRARGRKTGTGRPPGGKGATGRGAG